MDDNSAGILDEALVRLYATGPELRGWLSNHGTMTVEALARHGQAAAVHRWLDGYVERLEDPPAPYGRITAENWREALGDPRYLADWAAFFAERLAGGPWREVLAAWWPRLLPGIAAGATHPVIRVGHAVRLLLTDGENGPRRAELAQGLGYWAARHQPLPAAIAPLPAPAGAGAALRAVPMVPEQSGGINHRLGQITALPAWAAAGPADPDAARRRLAELVRAAAARYATHGHGEPVMLVHAVTAPNAVVRCLPALPRELWPASLAAAWSASAAVTAAYTPGAALDPLPVRPGGGEELFARAAAHGDAHVIKLTDTVLDVAAAHPGDLLPLAAAARSLELVEARA